MTAAGADLPTPTLATMRDDDETARLPFDVLTDNQRLTRTLGGLIIIVAAFSAADVAAWMIGWQVEWAVALAFTLAYGLALLAARSAVAKGRVSWGLALACGGILVANLGTGFLPDAAPTVGLL